MSYDPYEQMNAELNAYQQKEYFETLAKEGNGVEDEQVDWKAQKERDKKEKQEEVEAPF